MKVPTITATYGWKDPDDYMKIDQSRSSRVFTAGDINGLSQIADEYDAIMCDLWGTLHDGVTLFPRAVEALQYYRFEKKGKVVLLTNSPRPASHTKAHLENMGLPRDCWDAIVTSGDVSVDILSKRLHIPIYHIGPDRNLVLFDEVEGRTGVRPHLCNAENAEMIVCTGTSGRKPVEFDELLKRLAARRLAMLCVNPDLVAPLGASFGFCAGTLAHRYLGFGGRVRYTGKPYQLIYSKALAAAGSPPSNRILAIGDGLETDIRGAVRRNWDALQVVYAPGLQSGGTLSEQSLHSESTPSSLVW